MFIDMIEKKTHILLEAYEEFDENIQNPLFK